MTTDAWTAAHCRVFRGLFELCGEAGGAPAGVEPAELAIALTSLAGQFAWHAELLYDLLPTRAGTDAAALVEVPDAAADGALKALEAIAHHGELGALCCALARVVVPRLAAGVAGARSRTDARVDGPRARALTLIANDLAAASLLLEPLAERSMASPDEFDRVVASCAAVERPLVAAGVAVGLVGDGQSARGG